MFYWLIMVMGRLVWFLPLPITLPGTRLEGGRIVSKPITHRAFFLFEMWRWKTLTFVFSQVYGFLEEFCIPAWKSFTKEGFRRAGSKNPQSVDAHRRAVRFRFVLAALERGFSFKEILEGILKIDVHEIDEILDGDKARLRTPHRKAQRAFFIRNWRAPERWIPKASGGVSERWVEGYEEGLVLANRTLKEMGTSWLLRLLILKLYREFHIGKSRVDILARDVHYEETVTEGISEGVDVSHFASEAMAAIYDNVIRSNVFNAYLEAERAGTQQPLMVTENASKRKGSTTRGGEKLDTA